MSLDNSLIVIESKNNKFLSVIKPDEHFITNDGKISYNDIKSVPSIVISSTGNEFNIYSPTYKEFVLLMRRGPQIIYPKDIGSIIVDSNITNRSSVLEIGTGSGALTLYLILILGKNGKIFSIDSEKKNQYRAKKTIERYISSFAEEFEYNLELIEGELINFSLHDLPDNIDSIITDVPEPWEFFINNKIKNNITWVS